MLRRSFTPRVVLAYAVACLPAGACGGLVSGSIDAAPEASSAFHVDAHAPAYTDAVPPRFDASLAPTCGDCLALACKDLYTQCERSSDCYGVIECVVSGKEAASCVCAAPEAARGPYLALARCQDDVACDGAECARPCAPADAGISIACGAPVAPTACADPGYRAPVARSSTATCDACIAGACASFSVACGAGSDCLAYLTCLATCGDAACASSCAAAHATGETAADALDVCLGSECLADCDY